MKIGKLVLQNIGVYRNRNEFDLQTDKPIILIGGMNGRGKTTFLEAVLLALYGRHAGELFESRQRFEEYLRRISNRSGETSQCFAELHFNVTEQGDAQYRVRRAWDWQDKALKFTTFVEKNGKEDEALSENWDMFVEEILPHGVAPFFFFDGEKIAELAASQNDEHLSNSIVSMLGIDRIVRLIEDLSVVIAMCQKELKQGSFEGELLELQDQGKLLEEQLEISRERLRKREGELQELGEKLRQCESAYTVQGGHYSAYQARFQEEKRELLLEKGENQAKLLELAASSLPLGLVEPLLRDILGRADKEKEQGELRVFLRKFPSLYQAYSGEEEAQGAMQGFLDFVAGQVEEQAPVYGLDEESRQRVKDLGHILKHEIRDVKKLLEKEKDLESRLEELENYLVIKVEEEKLSPILERIKEYTARIALLEQEIVKERQTGEELSLKMANLEKNRQQMLKRAVEEQDALDENTRIIAYAQKQIRILQSYRKRLQSLKTEELARRMTACFLDLIAKDGLIEKIEIGPETLEFAYYNKRQEQVDKSTLSSGEKQLLVIAMLWALGICSGAEFPLIIDTPLARLDSVHRLSLIHNYFPRASQQVIILSTDQEITQGDYEALKEYVGREYSLVYDEETMSSSVCQGYLEQEGEGSRE